MQGFTIYGRSDCGYCAAAKRLLESKSEEVIWVDMMSEGISKAELSQKIGQSVSTVPQILHGSIYVGGYTELTQYL